MTEPPAPPIRVLLVQPTLAQYRVPVYSELAARPGIDFRLWYGDHPSIKNAEPDGFAAEARPLRVWRVGGQEALWHAAQTDAAGSDDVDVIALSWGTRYLSLGPALRTAKRRGVPVLLWGHGYSKSESAWRRWARDRIAGLAAALMFYDRRTADAAIAGGWPADRVFVAPNAIDQAPIAAAREACLRDQDALAAFREAEGLRGRRMLLYVSRFSPENRLDLLVEAIDRLRSRRPETLAVLVGGGDEFERIERMVADRGLEDHVRLLGPIYDEARLAPWFVTAEAFVYPAAIGLSLLHAFGYGLPVVTDDADAGHNPEIVALRSGPGDRQNGVVYRAGDAADLAALLSRLLDDDELRARLGRNARATVREEYSLGSMVDGMVAAIRRCAGR